MRYRKDMHVWKSSPRMQHRAHARVPWIFQAGVSYWKSVHHHPSEAVGGSKLPVVAGCLGQLEGGVLTGLWRSVAGVGMGE